MVDYVDFNEKGTECVPMHVYTEKSYLDYSMYVILDRALPHIGDGLKPVQRRIIYAMSELGLRVTNKHKKSARTIGDVLGKFHPHGDTACYEAMVLMAQPFSYRYPLIDGQGNWGSPDDPKSFAAMRYTEARMSAFTQVLLSEVNQGTVNWVPNFDGTLEEPTVLPARLPVILLNGTTGIAVGMATDIPPHNLTEVAKACIHLLENPNATLADIGQYIKGPDYPTDAEIISSREDIRKVYETGHGSIRMRAKFQVEDNDIVITALPYQTSGAKILEQIAAQIIAKKLPMLEDLRDESTHENPTRLVLVLRSSRLNVDELMAHLFATTDLERSFRVNLNLIGIDGRPKVVTLLSLLNEWIEFRTQTVTRRLEFRLQKVIDRLHLLDGLLIAYLNIDEVIAIIREEDQPKPTLIARFTLSERQAEAILELKLRHLAKLEEIKINTEQQALSKEQDSLEKILGSKRRLQTLIRKEIEADVKEFGDQRRSPIVSREAAQAITPSQLLPADPITVILSAKGWVRAAKGHDYDPLSVSYKSGDNFLASTNILTNQMTLFLDSMGRCYTLPSHNFPSARGYGEPLISRVKPPSGATFCGVFSDQDTMVLLSTDAGYGFIAKVTDLITRNKAGKVVLTVPEGANVLPPLPVADPSTQWLAIATSKGHLLIFSLEELPLLSKGKGVKLVNILRSKDQSAEEFVVACAVLPIDGYLQVLSGNRQRVLKNKDLDHYLNERGRRGLKLPRSFQQVDALVVMNRS